MQFITSHNSVLENRQSDLILLSKLEKNRKLIVRDRLYVQTQYPLKWAEKLARKWYGQSGSLTNEYLKNLYNDTIQNLEHQFTALSSASIESLVRWSVLERTIYASKIGQLLQLFLFLEESLAGLTNLTFTYDDDDNFQSDAARIEKQVRAFLQQYRARIAKLTAVYNYLCKDTSVSSSLGSGGVPSPTTPPPLSVMTFEEEIQTQQQQQQQPQNPLKKEIKR